MDDFISRRAVDRLAWQFLRSGTDENVAFYEHFLDLPSVFKGMTNGEVLKAVFPNMKVHEYTEKVVLNGLGDEFQIQSMAWKNWWDSPYKGVSE